jgi:hypothetical protein
MRFGTGGFGSKILERYSSAYFVASASAAASTFFDVGPLHASFACRIISWDLIFRETEANETQNLANLSSDGSDGKMRRMQRARRRRPACSA